MKDSHKLTEDLKILETKINNLKFDLSCLTSKLSTLYKYEEELSDRVKFAKLKTEKMRIKVFEKNTEISNAFNDMKNIMDVFTGNFYKN